MGVLAHHRRALRGRVGGDQVPLVDGEDARLVLLGDVVGHLLVEPRDPHGGVEEEQDHVGPPDRALGAVDRVEVEVVPDLGLALDPGGVDRHERQAVELEPDVDRVAGRPRPLRDDHPVRMRQGVDQGRLAGVGAADGGDLHHGVGRLEVVAGGEHLLDQLGEGVPVAILMGRDGDRLAAPELVELAPPVVHLRGVGLVHDQDDRRVDVAEPLRDLLVEGHHAVADIDDEEDQVGLGQRRLDLTVDVVGQVVAIDHADAAGIDQLEVAGVLLVADVPQGPHPIARDPRHVIDDGDPTAGEPVEQRRLADVGPSHDHDFGNGHDDNSSFRLEPWPGSDHPARNERR